MTHQQREGTREAPHHVFIVKDGDSANKVHNLLKLHGYEVSPTASEPEDNGALQQIAQAVPGATVEAVQAAAQPDDGNSPMLQSNAPRTRADLKETYPSIVGESRQVTEMLNAIEHYARYPYPVLILGETGVGKELVAQALHSHSARRNEKLVAVNCGSIDSSLMRNALFGHEKGAYTDAGEQQIGYFEQADGGTLFLDEIGDVLIEDQANFLRVLETGQFRRIGGTEEISVNVRIIAATNRDLPSEIQDNQFRADLYERLETLTISVPPLRERPEDIATLARHFLERESQKHKIPLGEIGVETLALLKAYPWPRNIRQLKNAMITAIVSADGGTILPGHLPAELRGWGEPEQQEQEAVPEEPPQADAPYVVNFPLATTLEEAVAAFEKACILNTLTRCDDNRTHAAAALGMDLRTFNRRLTRHQLLRQNHA